MAKARSKEKSKKEQKATKFLTEHKEHQHYKIIKWYVLYKDDWEEVFSGWADLSEEKQEEVIFFIKLQYDEQEDTSDVIDLSGGQLTYVNLNLPTITHGNIVIPRSLGK
ncbi:hypothetical protein [Novacetimonas hansenii]|uniref:Uncharacterized protein n=1 Tax=Novacetimonas hansenii TaxID=436 RepID=A0ABQ0SHH6_NOVHA|nr:hypothetical protein [Novacetimonas hansenii]GAN84003.1 hypothetical protein Gaha_0122_003 [Novacetimonas hansenii JCM 7643]GBQ55896.1 hypothetical protein AA0243_1045 [Novacetimonas hansenii NRIC 0243]GEC64583.1 hypothetical protein GHA01_24320 [Novacetimonas hansenii]